MPFGNRDARPTPHERAPQIHRSSVDRERVWSTKPSSEREVPGNTEPVSSQLNPGNAATQWFIGLPSWVLQDGNYTDFHTGERRQFALEFHHAQANRLVPSGPGSGPFCRYAGRDTTYEVNAHLQSNAGSKQEGAFVLDFGLLAYTRWMVLDDLEPPQSGGWLCGEIDLSVDPFDYMDGRFRAAEMPPMIYSWNINQIEACTTPPLRVEHGHPLYYGPDEGPKLVDDPLRESWRTVTETRIWDSELYRLACTLEPTPAEDTMERSGSARPYGPLP